MSNLAAEQELAVRRLLALPESEIDRDLADRVIALMLPELDGPNAVLAAIGVSRAYEVRWAMTHDEADAEAALATLERLVDDPVTRAMAESTMGKILGEWYERSEDRAQLDEALRWLTAALAETAPGTPEYAGRTLNLARFLVRGAHNHDERVLSDRALEQLRHVLTVTPEADSNYPTLTVQLGDALLLAFEAGWGGDESEALAFIERGMSQLYGGPRWLWAAERLARAWLRRAIRSRDLNDLQRALGYLGEVAQRAPDPWNKIELATALSLRAELDQDVNDLIRAETLLDAVLAETSGATAERAEALISHADIVRQLADALGDSGGLEEAVGELRDAIGWATAAGETMTLVRGLINLGTVLTSRGRVTDNAVDLSAAIEYLSAARQHESSPEAQAIIAQRMGSVLLRQYQITEEPSDLLAAVRELEAAWAAVRGATAVPAQLEADLATARAFAAVAEGRTEAAPSQLDGAITHHQEIAATAPVYGASSKAAAESPQGLLSLKSYRTSDSHPVEEANRPLGGRMRGNTTGITPSSAEEALALGVYLTEQYRTVGQPTALDTAIDILHGGTDLPGTPNLIADLHMNLGIALRHRFLRDGGRLDIDAAIEVGSRAVAIDAAPSRMANLANALRVRFERYHDETDLAAAVQYSREAVRVTPADDPTRAGVLTALGNALQARVALRGGATEMTEIIEIRRAALQNLADDDPRLPRNLGNLGGALVERYRASGSVEDLDEAVASFERALEQSADDHVEHATAAANLAIALSLRWEARQEAKDLEHRVQAGRRALAAAPEGHPFQIVAMCTLADALTSRFQRIGDQSDLDQAIYILQQALSTTAKQHPDRTEEAANLGTNPAIDNQEESSSAHPETGVIALQGVAKHLPDDNRGRSTILVSLSTAMRARYQRSGSGADLNEAVRLAEEAADMHGIAPSDRAAALTGLTVFLLDRYQAGGDIADLEQAVDRARSADELAVQVSHARAPAAVNLSLALRALFERRGEAADIEAAITAAQHAIDIALTHAERAGAWSALGNAWQARYEREGQLSDLREAVQAHRQAKNAWPGGGPSAAGLLHNLGSVLRDWYLAENDLAALDESVTAMRGAVSADPRPGPERVSSLTGLGISLRTRFEALRRTDDLQGAIEVQRQAVAAADYAARRGPLANLANSLETRSEVTGDMDDMRAAIALRRDACSVEPLDDPQRCTVLLALGHSLRALAKNGEVSLTRDALESYREASLMSTASPQDRAAAARGWGETAHALSDREQAAEGLAYAVRLLDRVVWHGLDQETRERQLVRFSGLATDAAAAAVLAHRPESAVELLEQGRSVLWTQALRLRSDVAALAEVPPELVRRWEEIGADLSAKAVPGGDGSAVRWGAIAVTEWQVRNRRALANEWDDLVKRIRESGCNSFLEPMPYRHLLEAVRGGPLVIVNVSRLACHALVLVPHSTDVTVVNLPDVTFSSAAEQVHRLLMARSGGPRLAPPLSRKDANGVTASVLHWIWDHIAEPVLGSEAVRVAFGTGTRPRRIWWCPTGPAAMLPLHAGMASSDSTDDERVPADSVMARAVSSYTPTLAALIRCHEAADAVRKSATGERRQLAIGMPDAPEAPLPAVNDELELLSRYFPPPAGLQLVGRHQAIRERVLGELPSRPWVHWACHGGQNETDPSKSAFSLSDGPLTVQDLASASLIDPEFAYLSACETATGSAELIDEALHLAAATQLLGYPHVVATLWAIGDRSAFRVTEKFYEQLMTGGMPDARDAALALHAAVDHLRNLSPDAPLTWAPFIHLGP